MKNKWITKIAIAIVALLFILQPLVFGPHLPDETGLVFSPPAVSDLMANVLMVIFFYYNYTFLIDKYFNENNYTRYILILLTIFLIIIFVPATITSFLHFREVPPQFQHHDGMHGDHHHGKGGGYWHDVGENIFLFLTVAILSLIIKLGKRFYASELLRKQSEIAILNAQVNPHFIFNALNTIYILAVKEKATITSDATMQLSKLLRYSGMSVDTPTIPIAQEIQYIKDYINFQKLRFGATVQIEFNVPAVLPSINIASSLLMPFIENCFKYGINPDAQSDIIINLKFIENQMQFTVFNFKSNNNGDVASGGFGIANVQKRLQLIYPKLHTLIITNSEKSFLVALNITIP
jgi:Histidine kinase